MTEQRYISIDLGAESGRVMLARVGENGIFLEEVERFANGPVAAAGTLYWDILRLWNKIQTGIAKIAAEDPAIAGIGIDSWGVDFGLLDGRGQLLSNPVHYRDSRTQGLPEKLFARMAREKVFGISGIQTMELNTLFQLMALKQQNPALLDHARVLLFIPDLIAYWLTGRAANEYTIASTSQMLGAKTRQWSPEILAAVGLSPTLFPPMLFPGRHDSTFGPVLASPGQTIKAAGVPVLAVGSHDTASAVAAVPASGEDWLFLSSGTWSLLGVEVAAPVLTEAAIKYNLTNEGGVGGRIRLLKNIPGLWLLQECRRAWAAQGKDFDYKTLVELARESSPHLAKLDLDDPAFLVPGKMPEKIAAQCRQAGQKAPETPGQFARVILESLAVRYAQVAAMLAELTGRKFRTLHIVGGGSQNDLLCQMAADATGLTVQAGPVEATALGNALTQAMATGQIASLDAGRRLVAKTAEVRTYLPLKA